MAAKKVELSDNTRKRKRIVPTREAGTPAYDMVDELFSAGFASRKGAENPETEAIPTLPYLGVLETAIGAPASTETDADTKKTQTSVSPNKNFTKVSNSILKQAVPEGLFRGQSKHTYDVLYLHTRGAINPVRQIQLTKLELVKLTGLEIKTIQRHLSFLKTSGLILVDSKIGDHKGAIYEVNIPEEFATLPYPTLPQYTVPKAGVLYTPLPGVKYTRVGLGLSQENIDENASPKTSLKTFKDIDDEPYGEMLDVLTNISAKISGKTPQKADRAKWKEFAELIGMELEIAAARTDSISNVPAFLTEHLRRRLLGKIDPPKSKANKSSQTDKTQSVEVHAFVAEPLTTESRKVVLKTFKEYIEKGQRDFVLSFEETYTKEDWLFLMENLQ